MIESRAPPTCAEKLVAAERHVPLLPDDFFAVLDTARKRAGRGTLPPVSAALLAQADLDDAFKTPRLGTGGGGEFDEAGEGEGDGVWWSGGGGGDGSPARVSGMSPNASSAMQGAATAGRGRDHRSASLSSGAGPDPDSSYESIGGVEETPKPSFGFRF